jgi:[ribosomal protein S5]-alanine N-acetyltransferase
VELGPPPLLETARLRLRPFEPRDLDDLYALESDVEVMRYGSHVPWTLRAQAEAKLAEILDPAPSSTVFHWVIAEREADRMIGDCVLFSINRDHARCEVGFSLFPAYQGRGFAHEVVHCALRWAFDSLGMMRIEADADPRNLRSCRLLERLGFQREGLLRQRWRVGGDVQDTALYGLLEHELVP